MEIISINNNVIDLNERKKERLKSKFAEEFIEELEQYFDDYFVVRNYKKLMRMVEFFDGV